ncbi:MAG: hypothetical protein IH969_03965, partial [Candidatus Krumholzibacteriota bacterium]|nr:hypothetical protein [Candidatus Krumholzibacteriota bacterium]
RLDQNDDRRTHFDIRELYWEKVTRWLEVRAGLRKVFWGVAESQHVVDIINQTDLVENIDAEDKLGQPMVDAAIVTDYGVVELYAMPFSRERTFPGIEGRLRTIPHVDVDRPLYESSAEETHFDWAVRYSNTFGIFDIGVAHFSGTSRQPQFVFDPAGAVLQPFYEIMRQTSTDVQATTGAALWKLEGRYNDGIGEPFVSLTAGIEYTFFTLLGNNVDLGALAEYSYDDRDNFQIVPFQDDVFVGARLALNDVQDTQVLGGFVKDLDVSSILSLIEASRRIGNRWRLEFEFRGFHNVHDDDVLRLFRRDSYFQLDLARYF